MPRPLVPGAGVVAGVVTGGAKRERGERGARAGVAVRDDLGALGQPHELADPLGRLRLPGTREERAHLDVPRARDVALARVARTAVTPALFVVATHVPQPH